MTMMDVFMRLAQGRLEPEEWESWWGQHAEEVKKAVSPGDFLRIKLTPGYRVDYWAMVKCQSGVRQYLDKLGIFYLRTGEYERLAREADERKKQNVEQIYREKMEPLERAWSDYLNAHGLAGKDPLATYDPASTAGQYEEEALSDYKNPDACMKAFLKKQVKLKIEPLAKAYGMKRVRPNTFIRERAGLVTVLRFIGYFRGGGYESMQLYTWPLYVTSIGFGCTSDVPFSAYHTPRYLAMSRYPNWGDIKAPTDWARRPKTSQRKASEQMDRIAECLALELLPTLEQLDCLETFFPPERLAYIDATREGPPAGHTLSPAWNIEKQSRPAEDGYLFGVWSCLSGQEDKGYPLLEQWVAEEADYLSNCNRMRRRPDPADVRNWPEAAMYRFARRFLDTQSIPAGAQRRAAIDAVYDDVCAIMRRYYGLKAQQTIK